MHRVYLVLWIASLVSNIGTWMFSMTAGWVMADIAPSALMVSLVQAATSLPFFLFALPAGALADIFDRRHFLMMSQIFLAIALFIFAGLLWQGIINPWLLLFFTFLTGVGSAFSMPPWQAIVPSLVPAHSLPNAIALNGVSINLARALGPALGGVILVSAGAMATVALDALSYLAVVAGLIWWRTAYKKEENLPRERVVGAMRAGVRFVLLSKPLKFVIMRAVIFFLFVSAYWALLPLIAKHILAGGPGVYSLLLTSVGMGALAGAVFLAPLKKQFNLNQIVDLGVLLTAFSLMIVAYVDHKAMSLFSGFLMGVAWIMVLSSLSVSAQMVLPDWVRARGLALFQMMFFGALTLGSMIWGHLAGIYGLSFALTLSAVLSVVCIPLTWCFKVDLGASYNHTPSGHWAEPTLMMPIAHDHGPVLVTVEYCILSQHVEMFRSYMQEWGVIRRRDGAIQWGFFQDVSDPQHFIEYFVSESWVAHMRQHNRVSHEDKALQDKIVMLHQGDEPPKVIHAVTPHIAGSL